MKKLAWAILLIILGIIAFFEYVHYKKYNSSDSFDYKLNDSIDINYYDQEVLLRYYKNAYEIGSFARQIWYAYGVDIRMSGDKENIPIGAARYYQQLWATTKLLENKLLYSATLKKKGYNNKGIKRMMEEGITPEEYAYGQRVDEAATWLGLSIGAVSQEVWELQQLLNKKGYGIPQDGTFGTETQAALKEFQKSRRLFPSGKVNPETIKELVK